MLILMVGRESSCEQRKSDGVAALYNNVQDVLPGSQETGTGQNEPI
jgi:hypothetical protein